jgi:hypothetical protein
MEMLWVTGRPVVSLAASHLVESHLAIEITYIPPSALSNIKLASLPRHNKTCHEHCNGNSAQNDHKRRETQLPPPADVYPTADADLDFAPLGKEIAVLEEDIPNIEQRLYQVLTPFTLIPLRPRLA